MSADTREARIAAYVARKVADAPQLSDEAHDRIAEILRPAVRRALIEQQETAA